MPTVAQKSLNITVKRPVGRPSKYQDDIEEVVEAYLFKECIDVFNPRTRRLDVNLPSIEGLALYLNVNRDTLYSLAKRHENYQLALQRVKVQQRLRLINQGLAGNYSTSIACLMLRMNHGMSVQKTADNRKAKRIVREVYRLADELNIQRNI